MEFKGWVCGGDEEAAIDKLPIRHVPKLTITLCLYTPTAGTWYSVDLTHQKFPHMDPLMSDVTRWLDLVLTRHKLCNLHPSASLPATTQSLRRSLPSPRGPYLYVSAYPIRCRPVHARIDHSNRALSSRLHRPLDARKAVPRSHCKRFHKGSSLTSDLETAPPVSSSSLPLLPLALIRYGTGLDDRRARVLSAFGPRAKQQKMVHLRIITVVSLAVVRRPRVSKDFTAGLAQGLPDCVQVDQATLPYVGEGSR